jgi:hypothetical protein
MGGAMIIPSYTYRHDRPAVWNGDTLKAVQFKIMYEATLIPIVPNSVCAQIRDKYGKILHTYDVEIYPDGAVVLPDVLADWKAVDGFYDVEYRLDNDINRTFFTGTVTVLKDVSKC